MKMEELGRAWQQRKAERAAQKDAAPQQQNAPATPRADQKTPSFRKQFGSWAARRVSQKLPAPFRRKKGNGPDNK